MGRLTAEGDTWGISGPAFIRGYLIAAVLALIVTLVIRWLIQGGRRVQRELHPYEVAYLIGGQRRTIATAVAGLRADGAIETDGSGALRSAGRPRTLQTPLDLVVHAAIRTGAATRVSRLATGASGARVVRAVDQIRDGLVRDGLAAGPRERRLFRLAAVFPVAVLVVGVVRLFAGMANDRPVGNLMLTLIVLAVMTVGLLRRTPRTLRSGNAAVAAARSRSAHLNPSMSPAWTTYGAVGAALGAALFGMAAVTSIDPEFAAAAGLQHQFAAAGGFSASSSGSSYSSGSSCGGSSCGGGGCGGGGCGGGGCGG